MIRLATVLSLPVLLGGVALAAGTTLASVRWLLATNGALAQTSTQHDLAAAAQQPGGTVI